MLNKKNSITQWHRQKVTKSREKKSFVEITTKVYNNYLKWHSPPRSKTHRRYIKISSRKSAARNYDSAYNLAGFAGGEGRETGIAEKGMDVKGGEEGGK